jgi:hypothetical protein
MRHQDDGLGSRRTEPVAHPAPVCQPGSNDAAPPLLDDAAASSVDVVGGNPNGMHSP